MLGQTDKKLSVAETNVQKTTEDSESACEKYNQANTNDALHQGTVATAKADVEGAATMLKATEVGLAKKKTEAARSKARALEISARLKQLTKQLQDLRNIRKANDKKECIVTKEKENEAKNSIEEFEECVDCQKKVTA